MSTTITNSQGAVNAYVTQQTSQSTATTSSTTNAAAAVTTASVDTYSLSSMAQELAAQDKAWSSMSQSQLQGIYNSTWNSFVQFDEKANAQGTQVYYDDERTSGTPDEIAFSKKVADYLVSVHTQSSTKVANPYAGASRAALTSIMYDDSGKYTMSEREAAAEAQQTEDNTYLSGIFASNNTTSPDLPKMYQGLLDYYDAMSPVEKSVVPGGYREQVEGYLQQQETTSGTLSAQDGNSILEAMLKAFKETTDSMNTSTLTSKEPIASQLAKIMSTQS